MGERPKEKAKQGREKYSPTATGGASEKSKFGQTDRPTGEGEREAALPLSMDDQFAAISSPPLADHAHAVMSLLSAVPFREQHPANLLKRAHSIKGSMAKATLHTCFHCHFQRH